MKSGSRVEATRSSTRRQFLAAGSLAVGGAAALVASGEALAAEPAAGAENLPPNVPEWMKQPGADTGSEPYGLPSKFEKSIVRVLKKDTEQQTSSQSQTPLQDIDGIIVPNGLFYERHHGGIPEIDPAQHRLMIHGLVERPTVFTVDDIKRYPSESRIHFLECSGNPPYTKIYAKTAGELVGLASCCEWTGAPLKTVLEDVGLKPEAKWIIAEGADAAALTRSIPIEKCLEDAMLVYSQNGERLRPAQGYPLRILVPGYEGNMNVKWLRRLHVTNEPIYSREETSRYTDLMPDGTARKFTFMMEAKSIITRPSGTHKIQPGFNEITGLAWTGRGKVAKVDVSTDGGKTWQAAKLQEPVLTRAFTRFRLAWTWDGKPTTIISRVTDETGYVQPSFEQLKDVRGLNGQYHNNATWPWKIAETGEVTNAHVKA
ncbi:sulfite dehydrogenase [Bradyrhizobium tropiciagri]|uniref:sulfite dehydrogenase n=1 Tax=Bradyrhizobium tropiciagri TaxID=312253 RepID=UPI001BABE64C|nr:sulfite dehydrogenase [Bradyrhizobium tropiciagri]MBR0897646.1 sulfite dehydrogenase [Bradyrhizobium tropiciagri]